jgi:hypothetical protein
MTNIQLEYDLMRKATDADAAAINTAHSVYGFQLVRLAPSLDRITVQYDASRLSEQDVEGWLIRLGVPIKRAPIPVF